MAYLIEMMPRAQRDLASIFDAIDAENSYTALKWFQGLEAAILTLETYPDRCPPTPESREFRHLLYGSKPHIYRVIYRVLERKKVVEVLHIRHGARDVFQPENIS